MPEREFFVRMNATRGKLCEGHTYRVSPSEFERLTKTRASVRRPGRRGSHIMEPGKLATAVDQPDPRKKKAPKKPGEMWKIEIIRTSGRYFEGTLHTLPVALAEKLVNGHREKGGRVFPPCAIRRDTPVGDEEHGFSELLGSLPPTAQKSLEGAKLVTPESVAGTAARRLMDLKGVGKKTAEDLKQAAEAELAK